MNKNIYLVMAIGLVLILGVWWYQSTFMGEKALSPASPVVEEGVFCTMEAKMCPDGSYVGRQGPNCDFSPCPN